MNIKNKLKKRTKGKIIRFESPARINLIGEHIDYVGGIVVPAAINLKIDAYAAKSDNIEICSLNFGDKWIVENDFSFDVKYDAKKSFMNFIYGSLIEIKKEVGSKIDEKSGFKLILKSSIPIGSGISSSAAFGLLIIEIVDYFYNLNLNKITKAKIFQRVENNFIGLNSGIMDQFAISLGKKNHFIKLNTTTLNFQYIKVNQNDYRFILISTNKKRKLTSSNYNTRVAELKKVASILKVDFKNLAKIHEKDMQKISDPTLKKRLKHIITEVARVKQTTHNLKNISGKKLGNILNASHYSLAHNYEVSCHESDFIHKKLAQLPGVFGSRMIGAGFGGCLLAVVTKNFDIKSIKFNDEYQNKFGIFFDTYEFSIEDGVGIINE